VTTLETVTLEELEEQIARFDALLRPIAQRPIDMTDPDWTTKLQSAPPPLEEAGIRVEALATARAALREYAQADDQLRVALRALYERYQSFRWAAFVPTDATEEGFRTALVQLSLRDQGGDTRDELLALWEECRIAREAGIDVGQALREVAAMSSDIDKYGMGSMRTILLKTAQDI
jgi:hypothetical protein